MRALARLSNLGTPRSGGVCAAAGRSGESRRGDFSDASRTCMKPPQPGSALSLASCSGGMAHSRRNARRSHPLPVMPVLLCVELCLRTRATNERISDGSPLRARGGGSPRSLAWLAARAKLAPRSREWRCARLPTRPLPNPNVQRQRENVFHNIRPTGEILGPHCRIGRGTRRRAPGRYRDERRRHHHHGATAIEEAPRAVPRVHRASPRRGGASRGGGGASRVQLEARVSRGEARG